MKCIKVTVVRWPIDSRNYKIPSMVTILGWYDSRYFHRDVLKYLLYVVNFRVDLYTFLYVAVYVFSYKNAYTTSPFVNTPSMKEFVALN